jgi:ketosteroid isomerase-like protein
MSEPVSDRAFESADAAEAAFYAAFTALDLEGMERVWSDGESAVCVHPGGDLLPGKSAVMQSWTEILSGVAPPRVEYRVLQRTESPGLAVHLVEESIRAGGDSKAEANRVLATNIYVQGPGGWRLAGHHASLPIMSPRRERGEGRRLH